MISEPLTVGVLRGLLDGLDDDMPVPCADGCTCCAASIEPAVTVRYGTFDAHSCLPEIVEGFCIGMERALDRRQEPRQGQIVLWPPAGGGDMANMPGRPFNCRECNDYTTCPLIRREENGDND